MWAKLTMFMWNKSHDTLSSLIVIATHCDFYFKRITLNIEEHRSEFT